MNLFQFRYLDTLVFVGLVSVTLAFMKSDNSIVLVRYWLACGCAFVVAPIGWLLAEAILAWIVGSRRAVVQSKDIASKPRERKQTFRIRTFWSWLLVNGLFGMVCLFAMATWVETRNFEQSLAEVPIFIWASAGLSWLLFRGGILGHARRDVSRTDRA